MNTSLPAALAPHYSLDVASAPREFDARNYLASWRHLERAHIIGQAYPVAHTAVHLQAPTLRRSSPFRFPQTLRRSSSARHLPSTAL